MKKKEQDSPLFSNSIMSTEDIFEEEEFDNNGLSLDLDHESLNDFEPVQEQPTIPLEAPLDQEIPEPDFTDTQDIFTEEPVQEVQTSKTIKPTPQPVRVKPTAEQLYTESYTDEPKKSYRKPIILSLIFLVIAACLIWFVMSFFASGTSTDTRTQTPVTTEQRQNDTLFNNRNNTNNNHNNNNTTTKPSQTQQPTTTPDNSTNDSYNRPVEDIPSDTYPDYDDNYNDYYPDNSGDDYYPDDSQDSSDYSGEFLEPENENIIIDYN